MIIGLLFFTGWELASSGELISPLFFPAPTTIVGAIVRLFGTGELTENLVATITRLLSGFLLGGFVGLSLGMLMGWSAATRQVIDPLIAAVHPVPNRLSYPGRSCSAARRPRPCSRP